MATLLAASTGGHLRELHQLLPRLRGHDGDFLWVTNDTAQSRALLAGEEVVFVRYGGSRDLATTTWNAGKAWDILRSRPFTTAISTGSGIALSFLPLACARRVESHYIESGTRVQGPSLTGQLLRWVPGVRCYTQHPAWQGGPWSYRGSVLDGFTQVPCATPPPPISRVVVTLGTWAQEFRALVIRLLEILPPGVETVWQTGYTPVDDLPVHAVPWMSPLELAAALEGADVVVSHAGMGATLDALEAGKLPVVVPRRRAAGEQIDDHQEELAGELERRGLALNCSVSQLSYSILLAAGSRAVTRLPLLPPFELDQRRKE